MAVERRTIAGWCHYLNAPDAELTLSEFMARCLLDLRENGLVTRHATEHLEGMLGSLDDTFAERDPVYRQHALTRGTLAAPNGVARHE